MYKVAVIDDSQSISEILREVIISLGDFDVFAFSSPETFLATCDDISYDIVFSDLNMPNISGLELAKILEQKFSLPKIFIIMSGEENYEKKMMNESSVQYCLIKPFNIDVIEQCLNRFIQQHEKNR